MKTPDINIRICSKGHKYYRSSDCPVCPICERERKPAAEFLAAIPGPARRALEREGINSLIKLSEYSEEKLLELHGMGPATIPKLRKALKEKGLAFRKK